MQPGRVCFGRGMLVGADYWLPSDLFELAPDDSVLPAVGCNCLRCEHCGEGVTVRRGRKAPTGAAAEGLFEAAEADLPIDRVARLYACRCRYHVEYGTQHLDDFDTMRPLRLPWACGGHPLPPWPLTLSGDLIDLDPPFAATVRALLGATLPAEVEPSIGQLAGFQAVRVFRLLDARRQRALDASVSTLLEDADPVTRRGALGFYRILPANPGASAVLALRRRRSLWSHPDPSRPTGTLQDALRLTLDAIERHMPAT